MIVRDAVEEAIKTVKEVHIMVGGIEPFDEVFYGRLVALKAIANVLDLEFSEILYQYLVEVPCKS
jgi:hypothetical protein